MRRKTLNPAEGNGIPLQYMLSNMMMSQSDKQLNKVNNSGHSAKPDATVVGVTDPMNYSSGQMSSDSKINHDTSLKIATWNIRSLQQKDKLVSVI